MKKILCKDTQLHARSEKSRNEQIITRDDFLSVWSVLQELPYAIRKLTLLLLPEDYLLMFWRYFSQPLYCDVYFSQYEIKSCICGKRVIRESRKGRAFKNLTSLSL